MVVAMARTAATVWGVVLLLGRRIRVVLSSLRWLLDRTGKVVLVTASGVAIVCWIGAATGMAVAAMIAWIVNLLLGTSLELATWGAVLGGLALPVWSLRVPIHGGLRRLELAWRRGLSGSLRAAAYRSISPWLLAWRAASRDVGIDRAAAWAINETLRATRDAQRDRLVRSYPFHQRAGLAPALLGAGRRVSRDVARREPLLTVEPFSGWRRWKVVPREAPGPEALEPVLGSAVLTHIWSGPDAVATCRMEPDGGAAGGDWAHSVGPDWDRVPPALRCTCGIYALKARRDLWRLESGVWADGRVELWGKVLEAERGFRAERARIVGPLLLGFACSGGTAFAFGGGACRRTANWVMLGGVGYLALCDYHLDGSAAVGTGPALPTEEFTARVGVRMYHRYGVSVVREGAEAWT